MIYVADAQTKEYVESIIENIDVSLNKSNKYLQLHSGILSLINNDDSIHIDFSSTEIANRIDPKAKKCSVIQAVEGRSKDKLNILDTTTGLGRDSFTLASRGHKIIAIEKDIYIYLLLTHALSRALIDSKIKSIAKNITLVNNDSCIFINETNIKFDCVYIDPMFPERTKSAKVKKDMQIMHSIAFNNDQVNDKILDTIFTSKVCKKAIVKRPIKADFLANKKPSHQLKGNSNRFDIYLIN